MVTLALALGFWLASLVFTGFAAGSAFATLRELDLYVPRYDAAPSGHSRLAGGHVVEPIFVLRDVVQAACAVVASGALAFSRRSLHGPARIVTIGCVTIAALLVLTKLVGLNPRMNADLDSIRAAIAAGDLDAAQAPRERFDRMHPIASLVLVLTAANVLIASMSLLWTSMKGVRHGPQRKRP